MFVSEKRVYRLVAFFFLVVTELRNKDCVVFNIFFLSNELGFMDLSGVGCFCPSARY